MADIMLDFEEYLMSQFPNTLKEVFKDALPSNAPEDAVVLYEYAGTGSLPQIASYTRSMQLVVRSRSAKIAKQRAWELHQALQTESGILYLTLARWCTIYLRQTPFKIKVDEDSLIYYGFNLAITSHND